jgi:predicted nucleic acid-binding protein
VETFSLLVTLFLGIITFAMLLQGIAIFGIYRRFQTLSSRIEDLPEDTKKKSQVLTQSVRSTIDAVLPIVESVQRVSEKVVAISETTRAGFADIDQFRAESTATLRRQMQQMEEMLDRNAARLDQTLDIWQANVVAPALEVGALVKGVKTGLNFFLSNRKKNRTHGFPEDDLFV